MVSVLEHSFQMQFGKINLLCVNYEYLLGDKIKWMICVQTIWKSFSVFFNVISMSLAKCFGEELARSFQNFFHTKTISAHYNKALN